MPNITPFQFESNEIRVVEDANGEPLFVAKDVAEALEYQWAGSATIKHVPAEWVGVNSVLTPSGTQQMSVLTEQGLYFFVARSDKPKALPFQKWIAGDVIPSIRKTGGYSVHQPTHAAPQIVLALDIAPACMKAARAFGFDDLNQARLSANRAITRFTGVNLLEAMGHTALIAPDQEPLLTASDLALRLGIGKRETNPLLIDCELQTAHRDHKNRLYYELTDEGKKYGVMLDTGKQHGNGTPIRQPKWSTRALPLLEARLQVESETIAD